MATSVECRSKEHVKSLVAKCLGKRLQRHAREIAINIRLVDLNLKPAYLLDYGVKSAFDLVNLLLELYKINYINSSNLTVLVVGMDYLIMRLSTLKDFCTADFDWTTLLIVDISKNVEKPCITKSEKITKSLEAVIKHTNIISNDVITLDIDPKLCNVSTLFGFLLGYPVLYWYETEDGSTENCLSMEPLTNYRIQGVIPGDDKSTHLIYSFSVPQCVMTDTSTVVKDWFRKLCEKCEWRTLFSDIEMEEKTVQLESVVL